MGTLQVPPHTPIITTLYMWLYLVGTCVQYLLTLGLFLFDLFFLCMFEHSGRINQLWKDRAPTVLPIIQELMDEGIRVWLYRLGNGK